MSRHGRFIRCEGCGKELPVTRATLKARKSKAGVKCDSCAGGKTRTRQRPSRQGAK